MSLEKYKQKRNFGDTPEPEGTVKKKASKLIFVIQRHHASHLHYDFRLELDGTLKSWAVPKGPSLNPKDKRLAMMVEDHPISYATFEGDIPEGNYGAGHVDVWDHGTYEPVNEKSENITARQFMADLEKGSIKFRMKGGKLKGEFALVKLKNAEGNSWLLIKHRDDHATDEAYNSEDYAKKSSLKYTEERKAAAKKAPVKKKPVAAQRSPQQAKEKNKKFSSFITPMLAKLHDKAFDNEDWIYEIKWDGYRAIAETDKGGIRLYSRNGLSFEDKYPVVFDALTAVKKDMVLDGEIVTLDEKGIPSFQLLQQYGINDNVPLIYYVFDILYLAGTSLEDKTLIERKEILLKNLPQGDTIKYCDHIEGKGIAFFKQAQQQGLEGIIAKNKNSTYKEGIRTNDWLKIKHVLTDEAVIAGYTAPRGSRKNFGALVLGAYDKGELTYIGHTGTGFDERTLKEVYNKLQPLVTETNPFGKQVRINSPVTWVKPELVCSLKYTEVTKDGVRRHPVFMGLREDKSPEEVKPDVIPEKETPKKKTAAKKASSKVGTIAPKKAIAAKERSNAVNAAGSEKTTKNTTAKSAEGKDKLTLTNLQKYTA